MKTIELPLWEILVPYAMGDHDGTDPNKPKRKRNIPVPYHQQWDAKVREITGGLTIMKVARGQWEDKDGKLYKELMIPVRIACTREQIDKIADFTIEHYAQKAVFVTMVSECTIVYYAEGEHPDEKPEGEEVEGYAFYYPSTNGIGGYTTDLSNENIVHILHEDPGTEFKPLYQSDFERNQREADDGVASDYGCWSINHAQEIMSRDTVVYRIERVAVEA